MKVTVFDLDGTLALIKHRRHFVEGPKKDWDSFFKACPQDAPNVPVIEMLRVLRRSGRTIMILSGRSKLVEKETSVWLEDQKIWADIYDIWMRDKDDFTPDADLKWSWIWRLKTMGFEIEMVFDDRDKVVKMWRDNGIPCFQVAEGNF